MPFKIVPMITATVSDRLTDRHPNVRLRASLGNAMWRPFHRSHMFAMGRVQIGNLRSAARLADIECGDYQLAGAADKAVVPGLGSAHRELPFIQTLTDDNNWAVS
jgi:hypothetical protein